MAQSPVEALAEADKRFSSLISYAAVMQYTMRGHVDTGYVYYSGAKYHFDYPADQNICDGNIILNWNKEFGNVSVELPPLGSDLTVGGLYKHHQDTSSYEFFWTDSTATTKTMSLFSFSGESALSEMRITLNKSTNLIDAYSFYFDSGLIMSFKVLNMSLNQPLDEHLFEIDWDFVGEVRRGEVPHMEHHH